MYSQQLDFLVQYSSIPNWNLQLQHSMIQQFVHTQSSTWELDYGYDCSDENYTLYNGNYDDNDLIVMYFVLQPIR